MYEGDLVGGSVGAAEACHGSKEEAAPRVEFCLALVTHQVGSNELLVYFRNLRRGQLLFCLAVWVDFIVGLFLLLRYQTQVVMIIGVNRGGHEHSAKGEADDALEAMASRMPPTSRTRHERGKSMLGYHSRVRRSYCTRPPQ